MANTRVSELAEVTPTGAAQLLLSVLDAVVTYAATTISGVASDNSLNDSAAQFVAKGFGAGDQVLVSGGSNEFHSATVMARTAGKMVLGGLAAGAVADAAAGASITITKWVSGRASVAAVAASLAAPVPAAHYTVDLDSTADSDPGAGLLKFDNAALSSATMIYIDDSTSDGIDIGGYLTGLSATGYIHIQSAGDVGEWAIFKWTAITDASSYVKFAVTHQASKGSLDDADVVLVTFDSDASGAGSLSVQTVASSATVTPASANDLVEVTAQAAALTVADPSGSPANGWGLAIRIKDNGTARALTWGSGYRTVGVTLPTTTQAGKQHYIGVIYNSAAAKWDVVSVGVQA